MSSSSSFTQVFETIAEYPSLMHHEESLVRTPYELKAWWLYLEDIDNLLLDLRQQQQPKQKLSDQQKLQDLWKVRDLVGKRSIKALPGSYKLWKLQWEFCLQQYQRDNLLDYGQMIQLFETALRTLHKFPRVWMEYLQFLLSLPHDVLGLPGGKTMTKTTYLRQVANRALQALPLAQHQDKLWPILLECWKDSSDLDELNDLLGDDDDDEGGKNDHDNSKESERAQQLRTETQARVLRRYSQLQPSFRPTLCEILIQQQKWGEAAVLYQHLLQDDSYTQTATPQYYQWWNALADLCTQHPLEVEEAGVPWEAMVRAAVAMGNEAAKSNKGDVTTESTVLQEMQGLLWTKLADSYIRRGEFDLARSVLEEGMESVSRVRDFTILFDAYLQFEEGLLEAATEQFEEMDEESMTAEEAKANDDDWDILLGTVKAIPDGTRDDKKSSQSMADMELALARAEHLTSRRPILLNRVLLRQNPHNVGEWVERSKLYAMQGEPIMAASSLEEALKTVVATKANNGSPSQLVIELVKLYEEQSLDQARDLLDRICNRHEYAFRNSEDLAECYAAWIELELRHETWDDALNIVRSAVAPVSSRQRGGGGSNRVLHCTRSLRLWDLLLDLEESLGTVQTTKDAYNRAMEIKVATPMHILNFCSFLKDHKYFEESFAAFERGIELFAFPHPGAKLLWKAYLEEFVKRYGGAKVERARDLFQRCLDTCPAEESAEFFMKQGEFEEAYGLTKRALSVYGAMCRKVPASEKFTAYQLYIAKTTKYLGLTATRDIYQEAIEALQDTAAANLCIAFAEMETSLQEIDRARAVLTYGAQMADPRVHPEYWKTWNEFEIAHGNEETFREMLRIKRSVEAAFSTVNYNAAEMGAGNQIGNLSNEEAMNMIASREGVELSGGVAKGTGTGVSGFVQGSTNKRGAGDANLDQVEERVAKLRKATAAATTADAVPTQQSGGDIEEIDIDDLDEDEEENEEEQKPKDAEKKGVVHGVTTKAVPVAVFGGLANEAARGKADETTSKGALERLREAAAAGK